MKDKTNSIVHRPDSTVSKDDSLDCQILRRRVLSAAVWATPIITAVSLPVHAQTSGPAVTTSLPNGGTTSDPAGATTTIPPTGSTTAEPPITTTTPPPPITGNVAVSELHFRQDHNAGNDEYVDVMNCDSIAVDISGWTIKCVIGGGFGGLGAFMLPQGTVLQPNQRVRIWAHLVDPTDINFDSSLMNFSFGITSTATSAYIFNNSGDAAELLDSMGALVNATPMYPGSSASPITYSCPP